MKHAYSTPFLPARSVAVLQPISLGARDSSTQTADKLMDARYQAHVHNNLPFVKVTYVSEFSHFRNAPLLKDSTFVFA